MPACTTVLTAVAARGLERVKGFEWSIGCRAYPAINRFVCTLTLTAYPIGFQARRQQLSASAATE